MQTLFFVEFSEIFTTNYWVISGGTEVNQYAWIHLKSETKFCDNPLVKVPYIHSQYLFKYSNIVFNQFQAIVPFLFQYFPLLGIRGNYCCKVKHLSEIGEIFFI